jgi:hypothetical protein
MKIETIAKGERISKKIKTKYTDKSDAHIYSELVIHSVKGIVTIELTKVNGETIGHNISKNPIDLMPFVHFRFIANEDEEAVIEYDLKKFNFK